MQALRCVPFGREITLRDQKLLPELLHVILESIHLLVVVVAHLLGLLFVSSVDVVNLLILHLVQLINLLLVTVLDLNNNVVMLGFQHPQRLVDLEHGLHRLPVFLHQYHLLAQVALSHSLVELLRASVVQTLLGRAHPGEVKG